MARLLADENFPFPVVEALRRAAHDVVTVADAGKARQALTDKTILELAVADRRAVVTLNRRHFVRLHAADPNHAGIIVCSLDLDFDGQAARETLPSPTPKSQRPRKSGPFPVLRYGIASVFG